MRKRIDKVPVKGVVPVKQMVGEDEEDTRLLKAMLAGAESYLCSFYWCKEIREVYFGDGYGGIVAVFLFRIEPMRPDVDEWLWVMFGEVPPAYLVTDSCKTPSQAIEGYVEEVLKWVRLAEEGRTSDGVIPVYVEATPENAADVEKRMRFLQKVIVPSFRAAEAVRA